MDRSTRRIAWHGGRRKGPRPVPRRGRRGAFRDRQTAQDPDAASPKPPVRIGVGQVGGDAPSRHTGFRPRGGTACPRIPGRSASIHRSPAGGRVSSRGEIQHGVDPPWRSSAGYSSMTAVRTIIGHAKSPTFMFRTIVLRGNRRACGRECGRRVGALRLHHAILRHPERRVGNVPEVLGRHRR